MPKVEIITSLEEEGIQALRENLERKIEQKYLDLLDWDKIYFALLDYKIKKEWNNLIFYKDVLRRILEKKRYSLYCPEEFVNPKIFKDIWRLEEVVLSILKKYILVFYNTHKSHWMQKNIEVVQLESDHDNLSFKQYTLKIKEDEKLIIAEVKPMIESRLDEIRKEFISNYINNVYFDRHIYQPLLAEDDNIEIHPQGLNPGEKTFIEDLKDYFLSNIRLFEGREVFILRNLPRRGVGFFETYYFYPDFIIWVKTNDKQHLIFVEPHGFGHAWEGLREEKTQWFKQIKEIEKELVKKIGSKNIFLDSFMVSVSPYREIMATFDNKSRSYLDDNHILFQQDDKERPLHSEIDGCCGMVLIIHYNHYNPRD